MKIFTSNITCKNMSVEAIAQIEYALREDALTKKEAVRLVKELVHLFYNYHNLITDHQILADKIIESAKERKIPWARVRLKK